MFIVAPDTKRSEYVIATEEFVKYYRLITGETLQVKTEDDKKSDVVFIGPPSVNRPLFDLVLMKKVPLITVKAGSEEYMVKTYRVDGRRILILAGGLGRSTLYAVYHYFEKVFGCRWYWDGDIVPTAKDTYEDVDIFEKPRFEYRGQRYFAHRGCKRFFPEMWGLEEWKKEIDYLLKRRMNLFMLRMGYDDLMQKAFPDAVEYPTEETMHWLDQGTREPYDRRLFWPLKYRGELRKNLQAYAFERGFTIPEDTGTMTHWFSRTPHDFLEKKNPKLLSQSFGGYGEPNALCWDVRFEEEFQYTMQITETSIREYGRPDMFHVFGMSERMFSDDREENLIMKNYIYDRFTQYLGEKYPTAPVIIAGWDFHLKYTPDEVQRTVANMNGNQSIILDFTSDAPDVGNFTNWNVIGKFPYIFGMFQGFASAGDEMNWYSLIEERLAIAKADEYCKGMVMWPEISHSDAIAGEFLAVNTWAHDVVPVETVVENYAYGRYGEYAKPLHEIWKKHQKITTLMHWCMTDLAYYVTRYYYHVPEQRFLRCLFRDMTQDLKDDDMFIARANTVLGSDDIYLKDERETMIAGLDLEKAKSALTDAIAVLEGIIALPDEALENPMIKRDVLDMVRTIIGRYAHIAMLFQGLAIIDCKEGKNAKARVKELGENVLALIKALPEVLAIGKDYSVYETWKALHEETEVYPAFEYTLKKNSIAPYDRHNFLEQVTTVYIEENEWLQQVLINAVETNEYSPEVIDKYLAKRKEVVDAYYEIPLEEINKKWRAHNGNGDIKQATRNALAVLKTLKL